MGQPKKHTDRPVGRLRVGLVALALSIPTAAQAGAAACWEVQDTAQNNSTSGTPIVLSEDGVPSLKLESRIRSELAGAKQIHCERAMREETSGTYVLVKVTFVLPSTENDSVTRYGFGTALTQDKAEEEAIQNLKNNAWSWRQSKDPESQAGSGSWTDVAREDCKTPHQLLADKMMPPARSAAKKWLTGKAKEAFSRVVKSSMANAALDLTLKAKTLAGKYKSYRKQIRSVQSCHEADALAIMDRMKQDLVNAQADYDQALRSAIQQGGELADLARAVGGPSEQGGPATESERSAAEADMSRFESWTREAEQEYQRAEQRAAELAKNVDKAMDRGDARTAESAMNELRQSRPDHPRLAEWDKALERTKVTQERNTLVNRAEVAEAAGDLQSAVEFYDQAHDVAPDPAVRAARDRVKAELEQHQNAGPTQTAGDSQSAAAANAAADMRDGDYDSAIAGYEKAIEEDGSTPELEAALETARRRKADGEELQRVEQKSTSAASAYQSAQARHQEQEAQRRREARERQERELARIQADIERKQALIDEGSDVLHRQIERWAANQYRRDQVREAQHLDLSVTDPSELLAQYKRKVRTLREAATARHAEFQEAMGEVAEVAAKALAEANASSGDTALAAIAMGAAVVGGHAAINAKRASDERRLKEELAKMFKETRDDLIRDNSKAYHQYQRTAAQTLTLASQEHYIALARSHSCTINKIKDQFSTSNTSWVDARCSGPGGRAPSGDPSGTSSDQRVTLARAKIAQAGSDSKNRSVWMKSAELLAGSAIAKDRNNASAWHLKADMTSDPIDRLVHMVKADSLGSDRAIASALTEAKRKFSKQFMDAVRSGDEAFLTRSGERGVHTLAQSADGRSPLVWAVMEDQPASVRALLRMPGASVQKQGTAMVHLAATNDASRTLNLLDELGVNLDHADSKGRTGLYFAVSAGARSSAQRLAHKGSQFLQLARLAQAQEEPDTAAELARLGLEQAIADGDRNRARRLLKAFEDLSGSSRNEQDTYLSWAARDGRTAWLALFLDTKAPINGVDPAGMPILLVALEAQRDEAVQLLLDRGADPTAVAVGDGRSALHIAIAHDKPDWIATFLSRGTPIDLRDGNGATATHHAIQRGEPSRLQLVLGAHPDLTIADDDGNTPLHACIRTGNEDLVQHVLPTSFAIDAQNNRGQTPLHLSLSGSEAPLAPMLLARDQDLDRADEDGNTALHLAIQNGHSDVADVLIDRGAGINLKNAEGRLPIHLAASEGNLVRAQRFLDSGTFVNNADLQGRRPLHYAANSGHMEVVQLLLSRGADKIPRDEEGRSAAALAGRAGHRDVARTIRKHGESSNPLVRTAAGSVGAISRGLEGSGAWAKHNHVPQDISQFQIHEATRLERAEAAKSGRAAQARAEIKGTRDSLVRCRVADDADCTELKAQLALLRARSQGTTPRLRAVASQYAATAAAPEAHSAMLEEERYLVTRAQDRDEAPYYQVLKETLDPDSPYQTIAVEGATREPERVRVGLQFLRSRVNDSTRFYGVAVPFLRGPGGHTQFSGIDIGLVSGSGGMRPLTDKEPVASLNGLAVGFYGHAHRVNGITAGLATEADHLHGVQLAGLNVSEGGEGLQFGLANTTGESKGTQIGGVNRAAWFGGVQVGVVNSTEELHGLQFGLLCRAANARFPVLPLVNANFKRSADWEPTERDDRRPPTGSISVADGRRWVHEPTVELTLSAQDNAGVAEMCLAVDNNDCDSWQPYEELLSTPLSTDQVATTIQVWFRDPTGNVSRPKWVVARLDRHAPQGGRAEVTQTPRYAELSYGAFTDQVSGVSSYLIHGDQGAAPASCSEGDGIRLGSTDKPRFNHERDEDDWIYRVCAVDMAGNVSNGVLADQVEEEQPVVPAPAIAAVAIAAPVAVVSAPETLAAMPDQAEAGGPPDTDAIAEANVDTDELELTEDEEEPASPPADASPPIEPAPIPSAPETPDEQRRSQIARTVESVVHMQSGVEVRLNQGVADSADRKVGLSFEAADADDTMGVCVNAGRKCRQFGPLDEPVRVSAKTRQGPTTVQVWTRDADGGVEGPVSLPVRIDPRRPRGGKLDAVAEAGGVRVAWSGIRDKGTGVQRVLVYARPDRKPDDCGQGTRVYAGTDGEMLHAAPGPGEQWHYLICGEDAAGNVAKGLRVSVKIPKQQTWEPADGVVTLESDATATSRRKVRLELEDGVANLCTRGGKRCKRFEPWTDEPTWLKLSQGRGPQVQYVWTRDDQGVISGPYTAAITYDDKAPKRGEVAVYPDLSSNRIVWSDFRDRRTSVNRYLVVGSQERMPRSCGGDGDVLYDGSQQSFVHTDGSPKWHYRVCGVDEAGNVSGGATQTVRRKQ